MSERITFFRYGVLVRWPLIGEWRSYRSYTITRPAAERKLIAEARAELEQLGKGSR